MLPIHTSPQSRDRYNVLRPTEKHNAKMIKILCSKLQRKSDSSASYHLQVLCKEVQATVCGSTYYV